MAEDGQRLFEEIARGNAAVENVALVPALTQKIAGGRQVPVKWIQAAD